MKNKIYITLLFSGLCTLLFFITACSQEPIFYDISKEIPLEEANIKGNTYSIVKLKNNLYATNGNIFKKGLNSPRGWHEMSKSGMPDDREPVTDNVVQLASDANHLYALTAWQTDEEDGEEHSYKVWVLEYGAFPWKEVSGAALSNVSLGTNISIFDNGVVGDATTTTGRNAYVRVGNMDAEGGVLVDKVYRLNGAGTLLVHRATLIKDTLEKDVIAAARVGATDYLADTRAFCSNFVTTTSPTNAYLYRAVGSNIQSSSNGTDWTSHLNVDDTARNFAFGNGILIVGTYDGLQQVTLDNNGVPTGAGNFGSNAETTTGELGIMSVASFGDADGDAIYAGSFKEYSTKYNALWAYYPWRDNWNHE